VAQSIGTPQKTRQGTQLTADQLLEMLECASEAILMVNTIGKISFSNKMACELYGYTSAEMLGMSLNDLLIDGVTGLTDFSECPHRHRDGRPLTLEVSSRLLLDGSWLAIIRNIEDRKRADADLKYQLDLTSSITKNAAEGLCLIDAEGRVTYMNPAAEKILDFSESELKGKVFHEAIHYQYPDGLPFLKEEGLLFEVLRSGIVISNREDVWYAKGGKAIPVLCTCAPIMRDDRITGAVLSLHDISERKRFDEELHAAKSTAEDANLAKTRFLANISHEIRTPLGVIIGFADLALESPQLLEETRNYLQAIHRNGQQLSSLIGEVLDLSKIEARRMDVETVEFKLSEVIEDAVLGLKARERKVAVELLLHSNLPAFVITDPTRLRQILVNLVGNSIKFTEGGNVTVHVCAEETVLPEATGLLFTVEDNGIGITEDQQKRLFQPFSQADSSMTRKYGGTGLGLMLSRQLARALGGDLKLIETEPTVGSKFAFTITAGKAKEGAAHRNWLGRSPAQMGSSNRTLEGLHILLVDDSIDNQVLVSRYLRAAGAAVELAQNGSEALQKGTRQIFDIILMDIQMPIMDGHEATRRLREQGYKGPIIALTAHAVRAEKERALREGFSEYLTKPLSRLNLFGAIEQFRNYRSQ
jgi:PAS domain S-box-containing protein